MTYDRATIKPDAARLAKAVRGLFLPPPSMEVLIATSEIAGQEWVYRTDWSDQQGRVDPDWASPGYSELRWREGQGGFGTRGTPGAIIRTVWNTPEIWMRRSVEIPRGTGKSPHLRIHHDEDVEVYLDGNLLWSGKGYTTGYILIPLRQELIRPGLHTLAVHCKQTAGGQYIDVGIVNVVDQGS
jgi:hypothetical protein